MKKLQMIAVLILSLLFVSACVPDDEEYFGNEETTDTMPSGNSDTTGDTLPDTPTEPTTEPTAEPTEPTNPTDPTEPTNPTEPTEPTNPTEPTEPTNPTEPTEPTNPTDPTEPTNPTDPTEPTNPTDPTEPTNPTDPTEPTNPTDPTEPTSPSGLPECSSADITPCVDSSSTRIWSKKSPNNMSWDSANSFCSNLSEEGYPKGSWRMPEIYELRTLIQNCSSTQTNGSCHITDTCTAFTDECRSGCSTCSNNTSGYYSKLGDAEFLWSHSFLDDSVYFVWTINFTNTSFSYSSYASDSYRVRCIKK